MWFADEARIGQKNKITRRWMVETAAEELAQDLESGGASPNGAGPRPASARELARLGPQLHDERLDGQFGLYNGNGGGGGGGGYDNGALIELRQRLDALEARVAKRDKVFQRLLSLLSIEGSGG